MSSQRLWRQMDLLSPTDMERAQVTVIGAGGIGSPTVIGLARMGIPGLTIYDDDIVELHNLAYQCYRKVDIGRLKVEALAEIVAEVAETTVVTIPERFTSQRLDGIVIVAVDTMRDRKVIFKAASYDPQVKLLIEARMGAEILRLYTFRPMEPDKVRWYEQHMLYDDEEALEEACTAQAINYTGSIAAGLIARQVKMFLKGERFPKEIIFDLTTMTLLSSI